MRLFFAVQPSPAQRQELADWRATTWPRLHNPVSVANLHMTLLFLGEMTQDGCQQLISRMAEVQGTPFTLELDRPGYWRKQQILWLGPSRSPEPLAKLVSDIRQLATNLEVSIDDRSFVPHITLARRVQPGSAAAPDASFILPVSNFVLFESSGSQTGGVAYRRLATQSLGLQSLGSQSLGSE